ncbi:hypothetical protein VNO77_23245 [Canavalia gladiata]|uniref:Uncharacterized protein n=1 Tax=Canavalia gladiata TaxID=3824 RepID=A0AAN9L4L7_CANGL
MLSGHRTFNCYTLGLRCLASLQPLSYLPGARVRELGFPHSACQKHPILCSHPFRTASSARRQYPQPSRAIRVIPHIIRQEISKEGQTVNTQLRPRSSATKEFSQVLSPELKSLHTFKNLRQETDQKEAEDPSPLPKLHRSFEEQNRRVGASPSCNYSGNPTTSTSSELIWSERRFTHRPLYGAEKCDLISDTLSRGITKVLRLITLPSPDSEQFPVTRWWSEQPSHHRPSFPYFSLAPEVLEVADEFTWRGGGLRWTSNRRRRYQRAPAERNLAASGHEERPEWRKKTKKDIPCSST